MITRVRIKNFRSLADVDVMLGSLTVLVGRNGAGKSAFLDALSFVRDILTYDLDKALEDRGGFKKTVRADTCEMEFAFTVETDTFHGEYALTLRSNKDGGCSIVGEHCQAQFLDGTTAKDYESKNGDWTTAPLNPFTPHSTERYTQLPVLRNKSVLSEFRYNVPEYALLHLFLTTIRVYSVFPNELRPLQKTGKELILEENGSNLASVLQRVTKSQWYGSLIESLKEIGNDVKSVSVEEVGSSYLITKITHGNNGTQASFELGQESDGTIRALAILTALYNPIEGEDGLPMALEEPELFLYPKALGGLSEAIKEAALRRQMLITTQSPDFISEFEPEELRVVEKINGLTQIGPIDERQRKILNGELFTTGDLLRIEELNMAPAVPAEETDA